MTLSKLKELAKIAGLTLLKPPRAFRCGKMARPLFVAR
jgi:hypothetical protein